MRELSTANSKGGSVPWVRVGGILASVGLLALAAPLIWGLVSAGAGLIALGVVALLGVTFFKALPMLGQLAENKILAARKAIARANPIEQLQNYLLTKQQRVAQFKSAVDAIGGQILSMEDMVADRKAAKQGADVSKQERSLAAMRAAHEKLLGKYQAANTALEQLRERIDDKKFEWQFGQAGQAALRSMNSTSGEDLLNEMLSDEAFSAVRDNFNRTFAELESEALTINNAKALEFDGMTLDVSAIEIPEMAQVKRN